jgi:hypothetical protein
MSIELDRMGIHPKSDQGTHGGDDRRSAEATPSLGADEPGKIANRRALAGSGPEIMRKR